MSASSALRLQSFTPAQTRGVLDLVVARSWLRRGLARRLLQQALTQAGGLRIDVLTHTEAFYESLGAQPTPG